MKEIDLGKCFIPDSIVEAVEQHKKNMLEYNKDCNIYDFMVSAPFSMWFSDYLLKHGSRMLDN